MKSNKATSLVTNVNDDKTTKIYGPVILNNEEFGATNVGGGAFPGAVAEKFKIDVPNAPANTSIRFTRDISNAPITAGGWNYESGQKENLYYIATQGSSVVSNGVFTANDTGWQGTGKDRNTLGGEAWESVEAAGDNSLYQDSITLTADEYVLSFDILDDISKSQLNSGLLTVQVFETGDATNLMVDIPLKTRGTQNIIFNGQAIADCTLKFSTDGKYHLDNININKVLTKDINVSFGADVDTLKFANGKNQSQRAY